MNVQLLPGLQFYQRPGNEATLDTDNNHYMSFNLMQYYTFSDVVSLVPKHYPHYDQSTWLCRQLSKEESEKLLRGRIDETFLVRATDLSGPSHLFTVDIV